MEKDWDLSAIDIWADPSLWCSLKEFILAKIMLCGAREMTQQWWAWITLPKDPTSFPSTHISQLTPVTSALGKPLSLAYTKSGGIRARGRSHSETNSQRGWRESPTCSAYNSLLQGNPKTKWNSTSTALVSSERGSPNFTPTTCHFFPSRLTHSTQSHSED